VRSECLEPVGHELSEGYEGERVQDEHEHKRQAHAFNDRRGFGEVEVEQPKVVGHAVVGERDSAEEHAGADEQEQAERPHPHEGSAARAQATDAQSKERTDQNQVREVRRDAHLARDPADQRQLLE
jgi:hypothetical protein